MKLIYTGSQLPKNAEVADIGDEEVVMLVDVDRCIRCGACQLACAVEYGEEGKPGDVRNLHVDEEGGKMQIFNLPGACRQCRTPCMYYDLHNFWIRCPDEKFSAKAKEPSCDLCLKRREGGYWPACATRCPMKTIYVGTMADLRIILRDKQFRDYGELFVHGPQDLPAD
jgi:Fe-S-cluster-containing dehydrogenase component